MATQDLQLSAFKAWQAHNDKPAALGTEVFAMKLLQDLYPNHYIARTESQYCNLLGYAAVGFATVQTETGSAYDATRRFTSSGSRVSGKPDKLKDEVGFGWSNYTWQDHEFIICDLSWPDLYGRRTKRLFVLADAELTPLQDGRHPHIDALLLAAGHWTKELHDEIYVFDDQQWQKSKPLYESVKKTSWDDVVLDAAMKKAIDSDVHGFFDNRQLYTKYGVAWKRGIIFHGTPGNGKSMCVKALITTLSQREDPVPSLYVKSLHSCNGPKWAIKEIFMMARLMAPCLLIFEDLDSLVQHDTRSYFLNEVDGLESNDGILMIGSTNHLHRLDSAVTKRPSRFDRKYRFNLPNETERAAYCQFWRSKLTGDVSFPEEVCELVAKITEGFSFAYLKELFVSTLLLLARGGPDEPEDEPEAEETTVKTDETAESGSSADEMAVDDAAENQSTTDGVVVEKPATTDEAEKKEKAKVPREKPAAKAKRALEELKIPEFLADNVMLKALVAQTKALCEQMDDTSNYPGEDGDDKKDDLDQSDMVVGPPMPAALRMRMRMMGAMY